MAAAAVTTTVRASRLRRLLEAYHETAWAAVDTPHLLLLRRSRGRLGSLIRLPRQKWLLRYFVVRHVEHRLDAIERRSAALAAFADNRADHARELEMIDDFRKSLPSAISRRLLIVLTTLGVVLATRLIAELALERSRPGEQKELELLARLEDSLLSLNIEGGFLDTIATTPFTVTLDLLFGLAVCTYLVLRVAYPGFRLKRMLFNLHPGPSEELRSSAVQPHVTAVDGVYRLESDVLAALGVRPQREFPFDLAVSTFGAVLFTAISASIVIDGDSTGFSMIVCGAARLAWLARAEHRRLRCAPLPATTAEPIRALAPS